MDNAGKLKTIEELINIIRPLKFENKKIVFTNGCFDILHKGHIEYLKKSKQLGDILIIGLNSDASIRNLKGEKHPINVLADRIYMLEVLDFIDYIIVFAEETPIKLIELLKPDFYTKGDDYNRDDVIGPGLGASIIESYGGSVNLVKRLEGYSTSRIFGQMIQSSSKQEEEAFSAVSSTSDGFFTTKNSEVRAILKSGDNKVNLVEFTNGTSMAEVVAASGFSTYYKLEKVEKPEKVKAVLLDLDGTIVQSEEFWIEMLRLTIEKCLGDSGFSFQEEDFKYISGNSVSEHLQFCIEKYCVKENINDVIKIYYDITDSILDMMLSGKESTINFVPSTYLKEFLSYLKTNDIKVAVVTSGVLKKAYSEIASICKNLSLGRPEDTFDCIITAGTSVNKNVCGSLSELAMKPHPWLYLEAMLYGLGLSSDNKKNVIGIEDSGAGVCALRFAGIPTIGLKKGNIKESGFQSFCIEMCDGLQEAKNIIEMINTKS